MMLDYIATHYAYIQCSPSQTTSKYTMCSNAKITHKSKLSTVQCNKISFTLYLTIHARFYEEVYDSFSPVAPQGARYSRPHFVSERISFSPVTDATRRDDINVISCINHFSAIILTVSSTFVMNRLALNDIMR